MFYFFTFSINQLVWAFGKDAFLTNALSHLDFIIVPCANPDGFEYSRSSLKPQIRLWRKNRSPEQCTRTAWGGLHCCRGVDLNRNFDFHWAETGSSLSACSNLFSGKKAFSEPEARAIANFLRSDEINGRVDAFVCLTDIFLVLHLSNSSDHFAHLRATVDPPFLTRIPKCKFEWTKMGLLCYLLKSNYITRKHMFIFIVSTRCGKNEKFGVEGYISASRSIRHVVSSRHRRGSFG